MSRKYSKAKIAEWKRNRKKWVKALRSGEYEQGRLALYSRDGHCCLGVLCEVAGMKPRGRAGDYFYGTQDTYAPPKAMRFVGLARKDGDFGGEELTSLNDDGKSFSEIADIIESEPPGLFLESVEADNG